MSKLVKDLVSNDVRRRLSGVQDAVLVNVVGMSSDVTYEFRKTLREKNIEMMVVKRTLAARATEGTQLRPAFEKAAGSVAVVWGCEDFVSLAKAMTQIDNSGKFAKLELKGGVMDGERVSAAKLKEISKWPSRREQISLLVGQIVGVGSHLSAQIKGPGAKLASQVKKKSEGEEAATEA
jgi:large subunit ribosomal protein L10